MDERIERILDGILDAHDRRQAIIKKELERFKAEHGLFLSRFSEKARTVIRPHFQEVGIYLKNRGHDYEISEDKEQIGYDGTLTRPAGITLSITPKCEGTIELNRQNRPQVAFTVNRSKDTVCVRESTMMPNKSGSVRDAEEYELDAITPTVIDKHIVRVLSVSMGKED